jgi:hypothetical protein
MAEASGDGEKSSRRRAGRILGMMLGIILINPKPEKAL